MNWSNHTKKWKQCQACTLCEHRLKVVLGRGRVPCKIAIIGEAPGDVENVRGIPFTGPAGVLLDQLINLYWPEELTYGITNLVACVPRDLDDDGHLTGRIRKPTVKEIKACRPRLIEFLEIAKPEAILCAGGLAQTHVRGMKQEHLPHKIYDIYHPSALLQMREPQKSIAMKRTEIRMESIAKELTNE